MDALQSFTLLVGFVGWAVVGSIVGLTVGRVQKRILYRRQASENLRRSLARSESRRRAVRFGVGVAHDSEPEPHGDLDDDGDTDDVSTRSRPVHRGYRGPRAGGPAAGRHSGGTDEAALAVAGYDR